MHTRTSRAPRWIVKKTLEERDADGNEPPGLVVETHMLGCWLRKFMSWSNFKGQNSVESAGVTEEEWQQLLSKKESMKKELSTRKAQLQRAGTLIDQAAEDRWQMYRRQANQRSYGPSNLQSSIKNPTEVVYDFMLYFN